MINSLIKEAVASEAVEIVDEVTDDVRYICKSGALITEALKRGSDVLQLPNGDILITELKTVTWHYKWDVNKGILSRVQAGKSRRKYNKEIA